MANFKLSQLQELRNITDDQAQSSYIMVVANDETGKLKNFRIKISELSKFAENDNSTEEILTADEIAQMINNAIQQHETVVSGGETIIIPEKIIEVDSTLKEVTETFDETNKTIQTVVEETLPQVEQKIQTVVEETLPQVEQKIQTVVEEALPQVDQKIINITNEIEILKTTQPKIDAVTDEHVDEIFYECFEYIK